MVRTARRSDSGNVLLTSNVNIDGGLIINIAFRRNTPSG